MKHRVPPSILFLAVAAFGVAALAQAPNGGSDAYFVGPGTKDAFLNGQPLLPSTAVLPGDVVTTASGGVVVMAPAAGNGNGVVELTGNGSATLTATPTGTQGGSLVIQQGNALVAGNISVATLQGQTFQPAVGGNSTYVVNAGAQTSSMGVLTGSVNTFSKSSGPANGNNPAPTQTVTAGNAIQINTAFGGGTQVQQIKIAQVQQPAQNSAVPTVTAASESM